MKSGKCFEGIGLNSKSSKKLENNGYTVKDLVALSVADIKRLIPSKSQRNIIREYVVKQNEKYKSSSDPSFFSESEEMKPPPSSDEPSFKTSFSGTAAGKKMSTESTRFSVSEDSGLDDLASVLGESGHPKRYSSNAKKDAKKVSEKKRAKSPKSRESSSEDFMNDLRGIYGGKDLHRKSAKSSKDGEEKTFKSEEPQSVEAESNTDVSSEDKALDSMAEFMAYSDSIPPDKKRKGLRQNASAHSKEAEKIEKSENDGMDSLIDLLGENAEDETKDCRKQKGDPSARKASSQEAKSESKMDKKDGEFENEFYSRLNNFFVDPAVGFKEEKLEKPKILREVDKVVSQFYQAFKPLLETDEVRYLDKENIDFEALNDCLDKLRLIKRESLNFVEKIKIGKRSFVVIEKILRACDGFLRQRFHEGIRTTNAAFSVEILRSVIDSKFYLSFLKCQKLGISHKALEEENKEFVKEILDQFLETIPTDVCDLKFREPFLQLLTFEKNLILEGTRNYNSLYTTPIEQMLQIFKSGILAKKFNLRGRETKTRIDFISKVEKMLEKRQWRTKGTTKNVFLVLQRDILCSSEIVFAEVRNDVTALVASITKALKVTPDALIESLSKKEKNRPMSPSKEGRRFKREFGRLSDYILSIISGYNKRVISVQLLRYFLCEATAVYKVYTKNILQFDLSFMSLKLNFIKSVCDKKQKKNFVNEIKNLRETQEDDFSVDEMLIMCANVSSGVEEIVAVKELMELEFENYSKHNWDYQLETDGRFEKLLLTLGFKLIFDEENADIEKLYSRGKKGDLITFKGPKADHFKSVITSLAKKTDPIILPRVLEALFTALVILMYHCLFQKQLQVYSSEVLLLWQDLEELYSLFSGKQLRSPVENLEHLLALKEVLEQLLLPVEDLLDKYASLCKSEAIPSAEEYSAALLAEEPQVSPFYNVEEQHLSRLGFFRVLQLKASLDLYNFCRDECKKHQGREYMRVPKMTAKEKKTMAKRLKEEGQEELEAPFKMPSFHSGIEEPTMQPSMSEDSSNAHFAVSYLQENQEFVKKQWHYVMCKPGRYTDRSFKIQLTPEQIPSVPANGKVWRWVTDWLLQGPEWVYGLKFSPDSFKKSKQRFLCKVRTHLLVRYRVIDPMEYFETEDEPEVLKEARLFLTTLYWCIIKKTNFCFEESPDEEQDSLENLSTSGTVDSQKNVEKGSSQYARIRDEEALTETLTVFSDSLESSRFSDKSRKSLPDLATQFKALQEIFVEFYLNDSILTIEESLALINRIQSIIRKVFVYKDKEDLIDLSINFLSFIFSVVEKLASSEDIEPIVFMSYMQNDALREGRDNILNYGLPYFEFQTYISVILEGLKVDRGNEYVSKETLSKREELIRVIFNRTEQWLENYHVKGSEVEGFEEVVCRLMEAYYFLGLLLTKNYGHRINIRSNLRKIMQLSVRTILVKLKNDYDSELEDWTASDWANYTKEVKTILSNEVENYQSDIFIPGFEDPCKNSIVPVLSETFKNCDQAQQRNSLDSNFLGVIALYSEIESLLGEWKENQSFSPNVIDSMRTFVPSVDEKIKRLFQHIVYYQSGVINPWIAQSFENEKPLSDGKFTTFYSDTLSYLSNFLGLFQDLLRKLPPSNVRPENCHDFEKVFRTLLEKFVELNSYGLSNVEDYYSESGVLKINRGKRGKPVKPKVGVFVADVNDFEYDGSDSEDFELTALEELCYRYSNLYMAQERVKAMADSFFREVRSFTKNQKFSLNLESHALQSGLEEMAAIIAHRLVYIDFGEILFSNHYLRSGDGIITRFNDLDKAVEEGLKTIEERVQVKESASPLFQAVFDVYLSCILWLILGSVKHKFKSLDVKEIEADFELFDHFTTQDYAVSQETFEMKSLKLTLEYLKKMPAELITVHRTIHQKLKSRGFENSESVNPHSLFVQNYCTAFYLDTKKEAISVTSEGLLAIIEHTDSHEAKKYLKEFLKNNQIVDSSKKKISINGTVRKLVEQFEDVACGAEDTKVDHSKRVKGINEQIKILANFQKENERDKSFNWKFFLNDKKVIKEARYIYERSLELARNYHCVYSAKRQAVLVGVFMNVTARLGFLLSKVVQKFDFNRLTLVKIIEKSAKNKFKKLRSRFPPVLSNFTRGDWKKFSRGCFTFIDEEVSCYLAHVVLHEVPQSSDEAIETFFRTLCEELTDLIKTSHQYPEASPCTYEAIKLSKELLERLKVCCGPIGVESPEEKPLVLSTEVSKKLAKGFPEPKESTKHHLNATISREVSKLRGKLRPFFRESSKPGKSAKDNTLSSKPPSSVRVFVKMVAVYKRKVLKQFSLVPVELRFGGFDALFFKYLNEFVKSFLQLHFPSACLVDV